MPSFVRPIVFIGLLLISFSTRTIASDSPISYYSIKSGVFEKSGVWAGTEAGKSNGLHPGCAVHGEMNVYIEDSLTSTCLPLLVNGNANFILRNGGHLEITGDVEVHGDARFIVDKSSSLTINGDLQVAGNANFNLEGKLLINGDISVIGKGEACGAGDALVTGVVSGNGWCLSLSVLPLDPVQFKAKVTDNQGVSLEWQTKQEFNSEAFIVERSENGMVYEEISRIAGAGNDDEPNKYSFTDTEVEDGTYYYRLSQVNKDGDRDYFDPVTATLMDSDLEFCDLMVQPNPCVPSCKAYLNCPGSVFRTYIMDGYGRMISELIPISEFDGQSTYHINKDNFMMPGVYILKAEANDKQLVKKVMIK